MSGGTACHCPERRKPVEVRAWRVLQLKCNHSAFNGYHRTASDWSSIWCLACGASWRTKSNVAYHLPAYREGEKLATADEDGDCTICGLAFEVNEPHVCPPGFQR